MKLFTLSLLIFCSLASQAEAQVSALDDKRCQIVPEGDGVVPVAGPYVVVCKVDPKKTNATFHVKVAPLIATTVDLPEKWLGSLSCGNCFFEGTTDPTKNKNLLFRIAEDAENRRFIFKPNKAPRRNPRTGEYDAAVLKEWATNVNLVLESGVAVSIHFTFTQQSEAVSGVRFELPEGATVDAIRAAITKEVQADASARCDTTMDKQKLELSIRGNTTCRTFSGRPNRKGPITIRMRQLCSDPKYTWATFTIENVVNKQFTIENAYLRLEDGKETTSSHFDVYVLEHRQKAIGVVASPSEEFPPLADDYTLTILPQGGEGTEPIELTGITFD